MSKAVRISRQGHFLLNLPAEAAFNLFTAEGERTWVPGWNPVILGDIPQERGLIFLTGTGEEFTIWTVLETDPEAMRLSYSRVTPASRAALVSVSLAPDGEGCRVDVGYDITALSPDAASSLDAYSETKFQQMMGDWRDLITNMDHD
ncbi:MAG: SRPBCC family protein [Sphingosinicella sp.]|nr:SRPBCC family protein [Sphingosinicella sp.]